MLKPTAGAPLPPLLPKAKARSISRTKLLVGGGGAGLALGLSAWLFLHELGAQPLQKWDESRLALNALNIRLHHDWLVMYCGSFPDSLNTKPPVLPILQALAYAAFGVSTWALRLPGALAAVGTAALLLLFGAKVLRQPWVGIVAAVALATMPGFNGPHVARTGEYDALLALFTTGYCLSAYAYLRQPRPGYLHLFGGLLAGALLVKCAAALLPLPGLVLYAWRYAPAKLRERRIWLTAGAAFGPLLVFYVVREVAYRGYLHFTLVNDWLGRVALVLTAPTPWWYYFPALGRGLGGWWGLALAVGTGFLLLRRAPRLPAVVRFAFWQTAALLFVTSVAQTRLPWYIAHVYPLFALAIGALAVRLATVLTLPALPARRWLVPACLVLLSLGAGQEVLRQHQAAAQAPLNATQQYGPALKRLGQLPLPSAAVVVLAERYNPVVDYYWLTAPPEPRLQLDIRRLPDEQPEIMVKELLPGQQVFGCGPQYRQLVEQQFASTAVAALDSCWCLRLGRRR